MVLEKIDSEAWTRLTAGPERQHLTVESTGPRTGSETVAAKLLVDCSTNKIYFRRNLIR
jgi:hypothetical protein